MMKNEILPSWNLTSIYPDFESKEYKNDIQFVKNGISKLKSMLLAFSADNFNTFVLDYLKLDNEIGLTFENLFAYASCKNSVNTTDVQSLNNRALLEEIKIYYTDCEVFFSKTFFENQDRLPAFFNEFPQMKPYEYVLDKLIQEAKHQMSPKEENLASDLERFGGSAWESLHDQLISNLVDNETKKTFNQLRSDAYSPDRKLRRESFYRELELCKTAEISMAACLNNIKGQTIALNKRRKWKTALEKALFSSCLSQESLNSLISAMEESLSMWQDYLETKSKLLSLKDENGKSERCHFYDLFAPVCQNKKSQAKIWTYNEAKEYITQKFYEFSEDLGSFVKNAFAQNWIDVPIKPGKVGGAFCCDFPKQKESRVLTNFTGTTSDVITLAHELGHAYHHHCIKDLDYALCSYPMTLAETASIFSETLVTSTMYKDFPNEKCKLLEMHLSDSCQVIVDILSRFYFEKAVFEKRKDSELVADDFCTLMLDAQKKTYGKGLCEYHPYMWAVKTHYYSPELDFYNFPYAFGLLFATGLFSLYQNEKTEFPATYKKLLCQTGSLSCEQVCKNAEFDITTKGFWKTGLDLFKEELKELKGFVL